MTTFTISEVLELVSIASVDAQSDRIALYTMFGVYPGSSQDAIDTFKTKDTNGRQTKNHHQIVAAIKGNAIPTKLTEKLIAMLDGKSVAVSGYYARRVETLLATAESADTGALVVHDPGTQQAIAFVDASTSVDDPAKAGRGPAYTTWDFVGFHPCLDDFCANASPAQIGAVTRDIKATIFAIADRRKVNTAALAECMANKVEGRITIPIAFKSLVDTALGQYLATKGYTTVDDVIRQYALDRGISFDRVCGLQSVVSQAQSWGTVNFNSEQLNICTDPDALIAAFDRLRACLE